MTVGFGPLWRIDGPPPKPRKHTLLDVATIVDDITQDEVDRWINGVQVYPYPSDLGHVQDACAPGTTQHVKAVGGTVPTPSFGAMTVYLTAQCSSFGIFGANMSNDEAQARFVARANAVFAAVEAGAVEREFLAGDILGLNPHLADGTGAFPWLNTATTVENGVAVLENEIAKTMRAGVIHMSPAAAAIARSRQVIFEDLKTGDLFTVNGTPVVAGAGYAPLGAAPSTSVAPQGHTAPATALQEWMYATGPIEVRRSELFLMPGDLSQALDRSTNLVTFRAERYYVVDWDTVVHSSVLVDRCTTNCGTPA